MAGEIKLNLNDKEYVVSVDDNKTASDIFENISDTISLEKYAGHEYTTRLDFEPYEHNEQTPNLIAGHIYYWAPGNAFVINYTDTNIAPYISVHIGEFVDKSVCDVLRAGNQNITINITKGETDE
jgi:hypothetical protein